MTNYTLRKDFSVVFTPPFEDSELISINMTYDHIELQFEAYENVDELFVVSVVGLQPKILQFCSDHLQNVVAALYVFKKGNKVSAEKNTSGLKLISDKQLQVICDTLEGSQSLLVVCPITGPELIAVVEIVQIELKLSK